MNELPKALLVPNRGEIARRVLSTAKSMGIRAVAGHSDVDSDLPFVREADQSVCLGSAKPADSYLNVQKIIDAAAFAGCDAVHPGYGFLSESAEFAMCVQDAGLTWVGPAPHVIASMGDKIESRRLAADADIPVSQGNGEPLVDIEDALQEAQAVGYPVMLKASAGGGGIGMVRAADASELRKAFESTRSSAERAFGSSAVFLERFVYPAMHIEVQILGTSTGKVIAVGERDCSAQRRHQKIVEESPAPAISDDLRGRLLNAAQALGEAIDYRGAGTVEFLVNKTSESFVFLEMNTRLQVEHPVTEMVTGIDLVAEQLRVAAGMAISDDAARPVSSGAALEFRVYAEDPVRFIPSPGPIVRWQEPVGPGIRVDAGYTEGNIVTPHYDPLLAKLCVRGDDRAEALTRAADALNEFHIEGLRTNLDFLRTVVRDPEFVAGEYDTCIVQGVQHRSLVRTRSE